MSCFPFFLVEFKLGIQKFLLECEAGVGVDVGVYDGWVLTSKLADLIPQEGIGVEVV